MKDPIINIARDMERALGIPPSTKYLIITNDSLYARSIQEKYPDFVLLVDSPVPLDTFELLEKEETADFIEKKFGEEKPVILVFKTTKQIEEICAKKGWLLLNSTSALAEKIENKITQVEWLGELAELLPSFIIAPAKDIKWEKKPIILQWAHAHTGEGTIVINDAATLAALQKKFPDRPAKASEFIKGPTFTVNVVAGGPTSVIGNPSYQITGMPPLTDSPFATVGNDWSLPCTQLNERHLDELRGIAEKVGTKMQESGWKGLFGIDVIYDEERDQFKLIEINARQPASTTYESQLQSKFRGHLPFEALAKEGGLVGATIFEAHLAALTDSPLTKKQIEINDGAQIVQRVTKTLVAQMVEMSRKDLYEMSSWQKKIADLNKAGYVTIPYLNTKSNSDFLRIQSDKGVMEKHGKWNARGEKIIEILEK
jgi:hypothetical protein